MSDHIFALLLVWHFLADYPLQGEFLSRAKNETAPITGVPWWQAMIAHCGIHGGGVMVITGSLGLGLCEAVAHFAIDRAKCRGKIGFNADQTMHLACKLVWAIAAYV